MTNTDHIASIRNLHIEFRSEVGITKAVRGVDLDIPRGKTTAIVGESGSGKSVMALSLLQLIQPPGEVTQGEICFRSQRQAKQQDSYDILALPPKSEVLLNHRGGNVSLIFQEPMTSLSPVHTIGNQVMEALLTHQAVSHEAAKAAATQILEQVGIADAAARLNQYPFEFSGGMRQRVCIAMALINNPELVICDEPTTALDVTVQAEILNLIRTLKNDRDMSVVFITHDLSVVAQIADVVAVMHRGRVLETGSVRQVLKEPLHPYTQALLRAIPGTSKGNRLATVEDLVDPMLFANDHPLRPLANNRFVALPPDHANLEQEPKMHTETIGPTK